MVTVNDVNALKAALTSGVTDITISNQFIPGTETITIPSGITLRDYWKIGSGNKLVVNAGANLRWGAGTTNNLLVGDASSTANLKLATGATYTITGRANGTIATTELKGNATAQQQATNPLLVTENEMFIIAAGAKLTVEAASDTAAPLNALKPVLSVHATGGMILLRGTLELSAGSRIVLGDGANSIVKNGGTIINNAGMYDGTTNAGVVGFLAADHTVVTLP